MQCEVWSVKTLLRLSLKKNRLSREGHGRDRLSLNYRSFMFGKLPPPACPGLCYNVIYVNIIYIIFHHSQFHHRPMPGEL